MFFSFLSFWRKPKTKTNTKKRQSQLLVGVFIVFSNPLLDDEQGDNHVISTATPTLFKNVGERPRRGSSTAAPFVHPKKTQLFAV